MPDADVLDLFSPATRSWFEQSFEAPTAPQEQGWRAIARGEHTLILSPTGSGKTLAAFLWCLDRLATQPVPSSGERLRLLYVSPLKALAHDVDRNLRAPLVGIGLAARRLGLTPPNLDVAIRTGDTPTAERRLIARTPPDVLITTPESLYLLLTSRTREVLRSVQWVILDEIHSLAGTKRGAHVALSIERLSEIAHQPIQRIGLSATQRPLEEIGRFLVGTDRPVTLVDTGKRKQLSLEVVVPVEDMSRLGQAAGAPPDPARASGNLLAPEQSRSIWPSIHPRLLDLVEAHRSTLIFVNSRRMAERLSQRLNELHAARVAGEFGRSDDVPGSGGRQGGSPGRSTRGRPDSAEVVESEHGQGTSPCTTNGGPEVSDQTRVAGWESGVGKAASDEARVPAGRGSDVRVGSSDNARAAGTPDLVRAHHGSVAREQRLVIEEALKAGTLRGLVATSSLELGIDMAAIDLVVQVESPTSVASGLQRIGRAGHTVDAVSEGKLFPKFRGDLLQAAVVTQRMIRGEIETTRIPRNPLDVLAQQVVAMCVHDPWDVDHLYEVVRRAHNFATLPRSLFDGVLDMLSGRYPSDEFADLKARLVWDRVQNTVQARGDARVVAVTSGGTIPDRGLFGVFLGEGGPRVGELDEEMVYESRPGERFVLGATTWKIEAITHQKVLVSPAPGEPGKMPFWKGDAEGRPIELGRAIGAFNRRLAAMPDDQALRVLAEDHCLDELAARNLLQYLHEQKAATGQVPSDRTVVVERFRDELGDWRVCLLTPFGGRVHGPWGMAIEARLRQTTDADVQVISSDDGIAIRLPEAFDGPLDELLFPQPEEVEDLVVRELGGTAMFAARFRENAVRALLLPRRFGAQRRPLWQMRQKAADLLGVASRFGSFPIILETYRECLQDWFDVPALREVLQSVRQREIHVVHADTASPSPFASSLLFNYIAEFMYDGDAPLAERRAQALTLDRARLRELLGQEELRELLDPAALDALELELQWLAERRAKSRDGVHDLLRRLGDLSTEEVVARSTSGEAVAWLAELERERRVVRARVPPGQERWLAIEDVARYRDALGVQPPRGVPDVFLEEAVDALDGLLARWARTHGPFTSREPAERWALPAAMVHDALRRLCEKDVLLAGEFRPGGSGREWCDPDVLRSLRRRSLAKLRREVEPVSGATLARFLPAWQGVGTEQGGFNRLLDVLAQLEGVFLPWSIWERDALPRRVRGYQGRLLDELCASGEVVWVGRGTIGADDGRVALYRRDRVGLLAPPVPDEPPQGMLFDAIREQIQVRGASFFRDIAGQSGPGATDQQVLDALWALVWSGEVTNDTVLPLRLRLARRGKRGSLRPPRLTRAGPPEAAGRWSLVATLGIAARNETERLHAVSLALLERHGVVTREAVLAEGIPGGFAALYPVLRAMEESGRARRGYFVEGLGAAQFALPGAVDRLRSVRAISDEEASQVVVLAAADPANPYGATLPWPMRPDNERRGLQRAAGAYVVLVDGEPVLYLERGGKKLVVLAMIERSSAWLVPSLQALATLAEVLPRRELTIERVNGESVLASPLRRALEEAGFQQEYLGLTYRLDPLVYPRATRSA